MKKVTIGSFCLIFLCIITIFTTNLITHKNTKTPNISPSDQKSCTSYVIKNFNGNVAVFTNQSNKPLRITEVCINTLPKLDQKRLNEGIIAKNQTELNNLLEDLCS